MSAPLDGPPFRSAVVNDAAILTGDWTRWLQLFWARVGSATQTVAAVAETDQSASIASTTVHTVTLAGIYRVSYYVYVTTLPTTNYTLTVTLTWRHNSVTKTQTFTALAGAPGTLATGTQGDSIPIRADGGTFIRYAVAYTSTGATAMVYGADVTVELVS